MRKSTWLKMQCLKIGPDDFRTRPFITHIGEKPWVCATDAYGILALDLPVPRMKLSEVTPPVERLITSWFCERMSHTRIANLARLKRWCGKPGKVNRNPVRTGTLIVDVDICFDRALLARTIAGAEDKEVTVSWANDNLHYLRIEGASWMACVMPRVQKGTGKPFSGWMKECDVPAQIQIQESYLQRQIMAMTAMVVHPEEAARCKECLIITIHRAIADREINAFVSPGGRTLGVLVDSKFHEWLPDLEEERRCMLQCEKKSK